jgi:hypothetical protein
MILSQTRLRFRQRSQSRTSSERCSTGFDHLNLVKLSGASEKVDRGAIHLYGVLDQLSDGTIIECKQGP